VIVSVTTLGSRTGDAAGAAAKVVRYLEGQGRADHGRDLGPTPDVRAIEPTDGVVGYYADSIAAPGIWMGNGLTGVRMTGLADSDQLQRVLLVQNPHTGEQLMTASGSAQRAHPDVVTAALRGPDDDMLSLNDAAEALGVGSSYLRQQVLAAQKVRAVQARQAAAGEELTPLPPSYLDATQDRPHCPLAGQAERIAAIRRRAREAVGLNQAIDAFRVAGDHVAALEPDAVAAARLPVEQRLAMVEHAIAAHVDEAIATPADYLITALGPRSDNATQRPRWDKAARALETWRHAELGLGPDDGALGDDGLSAAIGAIPATGPTPSAMTRSSVTCPSSSAPTTPSRWVSKCPAWTSGASSSTTEVPRHDRAARHGAQGVAQGARQGMTPKRPRARCRARCAAR